MNKFFIGFAAGFMITAVASAAIFSALYKRLETAQAKAPEVALVEVQKNDPKLQTPPSLKTESVSVADSILNDSTYDYAPMEAMGEEVVAGAEVSTTTETTATIALNTTATETTAVTSTATTQTTITETVIEEPKPRYLTNAKPAVDLNGKTPLVVIIDDLGENVPQSLKALEMLPKEVVFAYLPHSKGTAEQAPQAFKLGHEIMIHFPMEPMPRKDGRKINPGPYALYKETPLTEIPSIAEKNISVLEQFAVGVNNHMGSLYTSYKEGMIEVLKAVKEKDMFFLDSLTLGKTAVEEANKEVNLPLLKRDIFLDHSQDKENIQKQLEKLERIAKQEGLAIAIGHPHQSTLEVLKAWAPTLEEKGFALIPITQAMTIKGLK